MKYMFASDIHGSAYYCKKMLEAYEQEKADRLILLGQIHIMVPETICRRVCSKRSYCNAQRKEG